MTATRWKQVEVLFERALDIPAEERSAFLDRVCNGDEALRREIESLLDAHSKAGSFIDDRSQFYQDVDSAEPPAPQLIGHYRIVRELGRGGMGAVYLAERADEYQKRVAIKLIKRGMDTDSVLRHFRNERQILAGFDHPNIARLFDGGTTGDGLPYFLMEYIEGLPIDEYCDKHALSISDRLKLFREVCAAVSYAHRHLVIHRDLKRSNILVTADGVPKLLDFGIAKILQAGEGGPTFATMTGQRLMTPEYASPEQVRGEPVTTATDVYSLGLILYELLTGEFPYRFPTKTPRDIEHAITTTQPEKPSTVALRVENPQSKTQNPKSLKGDLDNIVLMALRKEPERRYQSVEQFSEDIRRHLEARPILARKDTAGYRAGKFIRRNKIALGAAALIFLTLLGGIIATTIQTYRTRQQKALAERRFNDVRKLAHSVLFDYHDAIRELPGSTKVRERLVSDALTYLDSLSVEAHGDPTLQRELAAAYQKVGDIRGGGTSANLGDQAGALESYTKSLKIRETLLAINPRDAQARRDVADSETAIGKLLDTNKGGDALEHLKKALSLRTEITQDQPDNNDFQFELGDTHAALAIAMAHRGDFAGALEQLGMKLHICEELAAKYPQELRYRRGIWGAHHSIARWREAQGDFAGAIKENDQALALGEVLIKEDPLNAEYHRALVKSYQQGGEVRREIDRPHVLEFFRKAAALNEELVNADPANAVTRNDLGYSYKRVAEYTANEKNYSEALANFRKAIAVFEKLAVDAPADIEARFNVAVCLAGAAGMEARLGQTEAALKDCRETLTLVEKITGETAATEFKGKRVEVYDYLGYAYQFLSESANVSPNDSKGHMGTARDMFRQALKILEDDRSRGILDAKGVILAKDVAEEIAKCDTALARP